MKKKFNLTIPCHTAERLDFSKFYLSEYCIYLPCPEYTKTTKKTIASDPIKSGQLVHGIKTEPMQNPDKSTARTECWNYLRDVKSTESHDKLFL